MATHLLHWLEKQFSTLAVFLPFFRVLNFRGRFEALNDVFWGFGAQEIVKSNDLGQSKIFLLG